MNRAKTLFDGWLDEMVMVGTRQDNTLAPSVSGHLHYDNNQNDRERNCKRQRQNEKLETGLID